MHDYIIPHDVLEILRTHRTRTPQDMKLVPCAEWNTNHHPYSKNFKIRAKYVTAHIL
jgi:hypothetical protein